MLKFGVLFVLVIFISIGKIQARCCIAKPINCYNCDSSVDKRCKDPFNRSAMPEDHPPVMPCNGCCVKWVKEARTANELIRRTCISHFSVNLFMVDRACMQERSKMGHICFCEEDICNTTSNISLHLMIVIIIFFIYYFQ